MLDHLSWWDLVLAVVTGLSPLLVTLVVMHVQNRRAALKLITLLEEYPLHRHGERKGPLNVSGITYPRDANGRLKNRFD